MHTSTRYLLISALTATAAFAAPSAGAVNIVKTLTQNAATACTLAIPTTNTGVRPRATGFRNEGAVNNFVICGFDIESTGPGFDSLTLRFQAFDGAGHSFSCTGMSRPAALSAGEYATKTVELTAAGDVATLSFSGADFPLNGLAVWGQSVTCLLPPGASIISVQSKHKDAVGR